ncbi:MAG: peptidylprolyl isomerase [Bacteroidales bacterium]|nr:peptidylprolyl isomerase [Bacteroidales bacterium]
MAVLQDIREKCGVLVIVIVGIALLAFLLGDFLSSGRIGRSDDAVIAKIDGTKIDYTEWQQYYYEHRNYVEIVQNGRNVSSETDKSIRRSAWDDILTAHIWNDCFSEVGIDVCDEELEELLWGKKHAHDIIAQNFGLQRNMDNGEYENTDYVKRFFEETAEEDANMGIVATYLKKQIVKDRRDSKYQNMVAKGFYTPTALAKMYYEDMNNRVDVVYAFREYSSIKDEDIKVEDKDIKAYYDSHKNRFVEEQETRELEYVTFDVVPSIEDVAEIKAATTALRDELEKDTASTYTFAQVNSSNSAPKDRREYKDNIFMNKDEVTALGFSEDFFNSPEGTTSDVFMHGNYFICGKIMETVTRPDSVNASHILLQATDSISIDVCKAQADSLADVLKKAKNDSTLFANLATQYSVDASKNDGGSLGFFREGTMIDEFNEACFSNPAGSVKVIESPFGIHVIRINSQTSPVKKVKVAVLDQEIKFSDDTYENTYHQANTFFAASTSAEAFDSLVDAAKLNKRITGKINSMGDNIIPGMDNSREIVRWAYEEDTKVGNISKMFESSNRDRFVIAKVAKIYEKGFTPMEDVRDRIEPEVRKQLKAQKMMAEMNGMNVEAVAQKFGAKSDTLTNVNFSSFSLQGLGLVEPKVNAMATNMELNKVSEPIEGNQGVFVIKVINSVKAPEKQDFENEKITKMQENMRNAQNSIKRVIEKSVEIDDRRVKFF